METIKSWYENIGEKIKTLSIALFILGTIMCIVMGSVLLLDGYKLGLFIIFGGPILSYLSSLCTYGFGELIIKSTNNERTTRQILEIIKNGSSTSEFEAKKATNVQTQKTQVQRSTSTKHSDDELRKMGLASLKSLYEDGEISQATYERIKSEKMSNQ